MFVDTNKSLHETDAMPSKNKKVAICRNTFSHKPEHRILLAFGSTHIRNLSVYCLAQDFNFQFKETRLNLQSWRMFTGRTEWSACRHVCSVLCPVVTAPRAPSLQYAASLCRRRSPSVGRYCQVVGSRTLKLPSVSARAIYKGRIAASWRKDRWSAVCLQRMLRRFLRKCNGMWIGEEITGSGFSYTKLQQRLGTYILFIDICVDLFTAGDH